MPTSLRKHLTGCLAALLCLCSAQQAACAEPTLAPRQLIDRLSLEVRKALENPKSARTPTDAERAVADQITALIRSDENHLSLTEPDDLGRTPLMLAASSGYPLVVQALLTAPGVRLTVNVADAAGETAWMLAQFAPSVTLVACQPGTLTLEHAQLLPIYARRMNLLLKDKGAALTAIVQALEAAGADASPEEARRVWLARCPNATPELREAIATQASLLPTLVKASVAKLNDFTRIRKDRPRSLPVKPSESMRFIPPGGGRERVVRLQDLLVGGGVRCDRPRPEAPFVDWTGKVLLRVVAETRAGIVEAADIDVVGTTAPEHVLAPLRTAILSNLSGYRCEGDRIFEQEFQFKYE